MSVFKFSSLSFFALQVCVCARLGLVAANLGVTCGTPEQGCGSGVGLGGHVITQHFV